MIQEQNLPVTVVVDWVSSSVEDAVASSVKEGGANVCSVEEGCAVDGNLEAVEFVNGGDVDRAEDVADAASVSVVVVETVGSLAVDDGTVAKSRQER